MTKILFVCSGNVGRSQMAEAYYNHFTHSDDASSAGTNPQTPKKYPKMPDELVALMNEENINIAHQKVKLINEKMIKDNDKIIVLREKEAYPESLLNSEKTSVWDVEDPYKKSMDEMRRIRNLIKTKILSII